jgi:RNA polymerase sigma-70 factor (ECF subfamily)
VVTRDETATGNPSATPGPPDAELVRATLRGDERAFGLLVRRYLRKAMAVALEYTRSQEDAEDVVQEAFRRVVTNLPRFDPDRPFEPWFFTIVRNAARTAIRSRRDREHEELSAEHRSEAAGPLEETHRGELRARLESAIAALPAMQQTCVRLCLVEGLSGTEAAAATGLAESTVRVHVFRARQTLQERLAGLREELEEA